MEMDAKMTDKEEIKRRLEEMKMKYAKMQRKLTKSESRKSAKNHVRRILAEQANSPSPDLYGTISSNPRVNSYEPVDSQEKRKIPGVVDSSAKTSKGKQKFLRRSISFKLEESPHETDGVKLNHLPAGRHHFQSMRNHVTVQRSIDFEENKSYHSRSEMYHKENDSCDNEQPIKVSRLSHNKTSKRKRKTGSTSDYLNVMKDSNTTRLERRSTSHETRLRCNPVPANIISESEGRTERMYPRNADIVNEITEEKTKDRLCLRRVGVFQATDPSCPGSSWDGICLHQAMSYTALIMYQHQTAVLWIHKDIWQARSQWLIDQGVVITDVVIPPSIETHLSIIFTLKRGSENELCFVTYNFETETEAMRTENLSEKLREAESIKVILNGAVGGAVMEKTGSYCHHIHFFDTTDNFKLWQIKDLEGVEADSFISVEGSSNIYLCLSSCHLSLWTPTSDTSILNIDLQESSDVQVDQCLWSKAEDGLLFVITLQAPSGLSLNVLNPVTKTILQIYGIMPPCSYHSLSIVDTAIFGRFLAVLFSNQKTLIWDTCTGRPLAEISSMDKNTSQITTSSKFLVLNGKDPQLYIFCM